MPANTNANDTATTDKPTLESALDQIETVKGSCRDAIRGLNDLSESLKAIHKEQKGTKKELQTVRQTIKGLQSVKL